MDYRQKTEELFHSPKYVPMSEEELVRWFQAEGKEIGRLQKHIRGFGFVLREEGDIYISPFHMNYAMHGDLVEVRLFQKNGFQERQKGAVVRILRHAHEEIVGTLCLKKSGGILLPDDPKITEKVRIGEEKRNGARDGDKVVVKIEEWPGWERDAQARVTEIISRRGEPGGDIRGLIRQYHKTKEFPPQVVWEAEAIEESLPEKTSAQWEKEGRRDLRQELIITIDGADSKDFDDAVSVRRLKDDGFLLSVHIADVSHYVRANQPLDWEALKRATSIYLLNQVIPMLPERLSNGICSLNPGEDRLTLSVDMEINSKGRVVSHEIYPAVIRSKNRMVYTDVSDMLEYWEETDWEGDDWERLRREELCRRYQNLKEMLLDMKELSKRLRQRRQKQGSIDFDLEEAEILLDEKGFPMEIGVARRGIANQMIEDFMVTANETVAEHCYWMGLPFIYRVHDRPSGERIRQLKQFLGRFGLTLKGNAEAIHPRALSELLAQTQGMEEEHVIRAVALRAMKKAVYSGDCLGHFGLGLTYYCHFTSPIRRYPDLMIHRIIKESLSGKLTAQRISQLEPLVEEAALQSSEAERQAQELEREVMKMKMAQYMKERIGQQFDGVISAVTSFGFFVQLENTVEGLVGLSELSDDYYEFQPNQYRLIGERFHRIYGLGDRVRIQVAGADPRRREIEFSLVEKQKKRRKKGRNHVHENKAVHRRKFRK